MKKILIVLFAVVSVSLFGFLVVTFITPPGIGTHLNASAIGTIAQAVTPGSIDYTYIPPDLEGAEEHMGSELMDNDIVTTTPFVPATEMDIDPESITVFVNKEYNLPKDYVPKNMVVPNVLFNHSYADERQKMRSEAASALEDLFDAAKEEGLKLYGISAYRSYDRQRKIFLNNIVQKGKYHTLRYSAVPGTSEHQTGLSIDVSTKELQFRLINRFDKTAEGKWLADNAHHYGYIIRYPKDKHEITGYAYEPWHIRYVGQDLADYLYTKDLTLDEYYNYVPSKDFNFELEYASLINYVPPVVTTIPDEEDLALLDEEALLNGEDQMAEDDLIDEVNPDEELTEGELTENEKPDEDIVGDEELTEGELTENEKPDEDIVGDEEADEDLIDEDETEDSIPDEEVPTYVPVEGVEAPSDEASSDDKLLDNNTLDEVPDDIITRNTVPNVEFN